MPDDDTTQASDQLAYDEADTAAGYRSVVDETETLDPDDPNAAACTGDHDDGDHEQFIGADTDDDGGVTAAGAALHGGGH